MALKQKPRVYNPVKLLINTPMYKETLNACWHVGTFKSQIALMIQLLSLQQEEQIPSEVTAEDMIDLLVEQSKNSLRVKLLDFDLTGIDAEARSILKLAWDVNIKMKMKDVEREARKLLNSRKAVPPEYRISKFRKLSEKCARALTKQQREPPTSEMLRPHEVVTKVVTKLLQGFWVLLPTSPFNIPSQLISTMLVAVIIAVMDKVSAALSNGSHQIAFSQSISDATIKSIQAKVKKNYPGDIQLKGDTCFAPFMLNTITDAATGEICRLFQTPSDLFQNADCSAIAPPTRIDDPPTRIDDPPTTIDDPPTRIDDPPTRIDDPPANTEDSDSNLEEGEEQMPSSSEPDSIADSAPPAHLTPFDEPLSKTEGRKHKFFQWFKKPIPCCFQPEVTE